jgi:hypothetical protein
LDGVARWAALAALLPVLLVLDFGLSGPDVGEVFCAGVARWCRVAISDVRSAAETIDACSAHIKSGGAAAVGHPLATHVEVGTVIGSRSR